jgi:hypothetical protein
VNTEVQSGVLLRFTADKRLAAAAGGVARCLADAAGMEASAAAKLQAATLAVCIAACAQVATTSQELSVEVMRFADRIEITVTHAGPPLVGIAVLPGVDRIDHESVAAGSVTRLAKAL